MLDALIPVVFIALSGILWRVGGKGGFPYAKQLRRVCIPLLFVFAGLYSGKFLFSLFALLYIPCFSIGYGESSRLRKVFKNVTVCRFVCGVIYCLPSIGLLWGNWWLMGFDFAITSIGVALAGSQAFKFNDSREEAFVGSLVAFCKVW